MQTISSRIDVLRQKMDAKGIMATIIPSTDPHEHCVYGSTHRFSADESDCRRRELQAGGV